MYVECEMGCRRQPWGEYERGLPSHWGGLGDHPLENFIEIKSVLVHSDGF